MPGISSHVLSMLLLIIIIISVMGTTCTCNLSLPPWASIMPGKDHGKCTSGKCPTQEVKRGCGVSCSYMYMYYGLTIAHT